MGVVHRATDQLFKREIAVKLLRPRWLEMREPLLAEQCQAQTIESFAYEAEITARLQHPGIPPMYDLGKLPDGLPFLAMKLIQGETLHDLLQARMSLLGELPRWLQIFEQVAQAVGYAHSQGVLHRDLKPQNVMVGQFGEVQVMDWGLAKFVGAAERPAAALVVDQERVFVSQAGDVKGTLHYMSPEQARGEITTLDPRTDVFGLGAILCQILTGEPPYVGTSYFEVREAAYSGDVAAALGRVEASGADPEIVALAKRCLSPVANDRLPDGTAVAQAIAAHRASVEQRLRQSETERALGEERLVQQTRRRKLLTYSIAAVALTIAIASTTLAMVYARSNRLIADREQRATQSLRTSLRQLAANHFQHGLAEHQAGRVVNSIRDLRLVLATHPDEDDLRDAYQRVLADKLIDGGRAILPPLRHESPVRVAEFSATGELVLTADDAGTAQLWNATSGLPHGPPLQHAGAIRFATFHPDGKHVLTCSADHTARFWDIATGAAYGPVLHHEGEVLGAVFSPDGQQLATFGLDKTARVWDANSGDPLLEPLVHSRGVYAADFSPDSTHLLTGDDDTDAQIWDLRTADTLDFSIDHRSRVVAVVFNRDGKSFITASQDHTARIWSAADGSPIGKVMQHGHIVECLRLSPDGQQLATGSWDFTARLWNPQTGEPISEPLLHQDVIRSLQFSRDGSLLLSTAEDNSARVWDCTKGRPAGEPLWHRGQVFAAGFSPDGRRVVSAGNDHVARIWELQRGLRLEHQGWVVTAEFSPDGLRIITASEDRTSRVWNANTGEPLTPPLAHAAQLKQAAFSPDGTRFFTIAGLELQEWDAATGAKLGNPRLHPSDLRSAAYDRSGRLIATGTHDEVARVWKPDSTAGGEPRSKPGIGYKVQFSPDGRLLAAHGTGNSAHLWNLEDDSVLKLASQQHRVFELDMNRAGDRLAVVTEGGAALICDAITGQPIGKPLIHGGVIVDIRFSPDGKRVVTSGRDNSAKLWDAETGQPLCDPLHMPDTVISVDFSPDSQRLITASFGQVAQLWDSRTGAPLGQPQRYDDMVRFARFSPDGQRVVTARVEKSAWIWEVGYEIPFLDDAELTRTWVEVVTGEELLLDRTFRPLSAAEWLSRREQLSRNSRWRDYRTLRIRSSD